MRSFLSFLFVIVSVLEGLCESTPKCIKAAVSNYSALKIVFRLDDVTFQTDGLQDSIIDIFINNQIPLTLGVIPFDKDGLPEPISATGKSDFERIKLLARNNKLEIAMHGFNHIKNTSSEFYNLPITRQNVLIKKGKEYLDSLFESNLITFIPPWNSYDSNTLNSLVLNKFRIISADRYGLSSSEFIQYIPCTYLGLALLQNVIESNTYRSGIMVILLHTYDFNNKGPGKRHAFLNELNQVLHFINTNSIQCFTFRQLLVDGENLGRSRYLLNQRSTSGLFMKRYEFLYLPLQSKWLLVVDWIIWFVAAALPFTLLLGVFYFFKFRISTRMLKTGSVAMLIIVILFISLRGMTPRSILGILSCSSTSLAFLITLLIRNFSNNRNSCD